MSNEQNGKKTGRHLTSVSLTLDTLLCSVVPLETSTAIFMHPFFPQPRLTTHSIYPHPFPVHLINANLNQHFQYCVPFNSKLWTLFLAISYFPIASITFRLINFSSLTDRFQPFSPNQNVASLAIFYLGLLLDHNYTTRGWVLSSKWGNVTAVINFINQYEKAAATPFSADRKQGSSFMYHIK